jgi:hypothetical protein
LIYRYRYVTSFGIGIGSFLADSEIADTSVSAGIPISLPAVLVFSGIGVRGTVAGSAAGGHTHGLSLGLWGNLQEII